MRATTFGFGELLPDLARDFARRRFQELVGLAVMASTVALGLSLATWSISDPSLNHATDTPAHNLLGVKGAIVADLIMQLIGVSSVVLLAPLGLLGWRIFSHRRVGRPSRYLVYWLVGTFSAAAVASLLPMTDRWPLPTGLGGVIGDALVYLPKRYLSGFGLALAGLAFLSVAILSLAASLGSGASNHKDEDERAPSMSGAPGLFPAVRADEAFHLAGFAEKRPRARQAPRQRRPGNCRRPIRRIALRLRTGGRNRRPGRASPRRGFRRAWDGTDGRVVVPARRPRKWDQKGATEFTNRDRANAPMSFPRPIFSPKAKKSARRSIRMRWNKMPACWKACWTISASRANRQRPPRPGGDAV